LASIWQAAKWVARKAWTPIRWAGTWFRGGEDAGEGATTVAAFLVGAFTLVASALAVIGLGEGDVDRAVINTPALTVLAFVAIVVAVCLGSAMSLPKKARGRGACGLLGLVALGAGLVALAWAAVDGRVAKDRPRIDAHIERMSDGMHVKGKVTAEGLKARDHVLVRIIGISTRDRLAEAHVGHQRGDEATAACPDEDARDQPTASAEAATGGGTASGKKSTDSSSASAAALKRCWRQLAYSSRTGATSDGKIDVNIDTPLATGLYERIDIEALLEPDDTTNRDLKEPRCDKNSGDFGCVTLMIAPGARRPELDARWALPPSSPPVLAVTARMDNLTVDDRVLLSVRRALGRKRWSRIYGASWAPNAAGEVSQKLRIPVAARRRPVCVIMRTLKASVEPRKEVPEAYGPCTPRSQGMAVQLYRPPRKTPSQ
jgi:hypothetical protein